MAKKKRNKVPKRIAGVKLPKPLRRGMKILAASQSGRVVLAEALLAAGAVLAATQAAADSPGRRAVRAAAPKVKAQVSAAQSSVLDAGEVFADAVRLFTERLRGRTVISESDVKPSAAH